MNLSSHLKLVNLSIHSKNNGEKYNGIVRIYCFSTFFLLCCKIVKYISIFIGLIRLGNPSFNIASSVWDYVVNARHCSKYKRRA